MQRCPQCGRWLVVRINSSSGSKFLGCAGWPDACRHTAPYPEYLLLKEAGAIELPGMDQ